MKKLLYKYWPILLCLIIATLIVWPLALPGYFSHHDDLQVMRIFEMRRCLQDFQIPCRWVPDMGYGNGYPLFNYYAVLPYYIGAVASFVFGFLISAKLLFIIPILFGAISMYLLVNELFGLYPGIFASALFTYAPYRALDLYVRGDIAESFAIATIPLVFYFVFKLIKTGRVKFLTGLSLTLAVFLTSHNIMTVLFMPVLLLLIIYWLTTEGRKNILFLILGLLIGVGLAAFFILPAYFEKNLVQIDNLVRFDLNFRANFVTVNQLFFSRFWGYGASVLGPNDTISFQVGWPHWWIVGFSVLIFLFNLISKRKINSLFIVLIAIFLFSLFMTHNRSAFVWEEIDILKFTQFPWRFLAVSIFAVSLLGGYLVQNFKNQKYIIVILIAATIVLNWSYFKPKEFYMSMTDQQKLSGLEWDTQKKAAILDYLPIGAGQPTESAPDQPIIRSGAADITSFEKKSNSWKLNLDVKSVVDIEIPIMDFPNWRVYADNREVKYTNNNYVKRINISLPVGVHSVSGQLTNTPIRTVSNTISVVSWLIIALIIYDRKSRKFFK